MRIGIDISQIVYKGSGVSRFTEGIVEAILQYDNTNEWVFFFSSLRRSLDKTTQRLIKEKGHDLRMYKFPPTVLSFLWNDLHILNIENLVGRVDWFITSDWTEPPANAKKTTIIHDLAFLRYPNTVSDNIRQTQQKRMKKVTKESHVIFTDSESTKKDILDFCGIKENRIVVNYPGITVLNPNDDHVKATVKKYSLSNKFILSVGKIEPRKNIARLIEAFAGLDQKDVELVIIGPKGWGDIGISNHQVDEHVRFLGFVPDEDLFALYKSCLFFVFPSIWEGFGYPALEAMSLGCSTALSNTSSLKEIGEGAAELFDPFDVKSIQAALKKMITNDSLRQQLAKKGIERSRAFTWKRYYDTMMEILKSFPRL